MQPHQERVIAEKKELDERGNKLDQFILSEKFGTLPPAEQERMLQNNKPIVPAAQAVFELDASANLERIADLTEKTYHTMEAILQSMKKIESYTAAAAMQ